MASERRKASDVTIRDVTIRGAGIFGLSVAWALAKRGARVRVVETAPMIGAGASGGLVGALAPHAPEKWNPLKAFQFESLILAQSWWQEVREAGGVDPLYARSGRLQPLADIAALEFARERARAASDLWQGKAVWQVVPASGAPEEPASPIGFLIRDTLTARLSPRSACAALDAALRARGAEIVVGVGEDEGVEEGMVVHASGVRGLLDLSDRMGRKLGAGLKGQAVLLAHDARGAAQVYAPGLHIVFHGDGTTAIGSTSENSWQVEGPDAGADALIVQARALLPVLKKAAILERWAGIRPRARSRAPLIGDWPGRPGHFIANGGFKTGFGMAPLCAELLAERILTGRNNIPAAFRPEALLDGLG